MQEISKEDLVIGLEYYIECLTTCQNTGLLIPRTPKYRMIAKFEKLHAPFPDVSINKLACFKNFRKIKYKKNKDLGYDVSLNMFWKFYEPVEDKIQREMERRSYNMVMYEIINDEYFRLEIL